MATLVYKQFYDKYDADHTYVNDIKFHVNLVSEDYSPKKGHKKADVKDYIICSLESLNGDIFIKKGMSDIVATIKKKAVAWIPDHQESISADVDKVFALKPEKAEKIKEIIRDTDFQKGDFDFWDRLVKKGIVYFVIEDKTNNILCWCEDIT